MSMRTALARATVIALSIGCSSAASVSGTLGGEPVERPVDAVYDTYAFSLPGLGDFELMALVVTDVPEFCDTWDELLNNVEIGCSEQCEDYVRIAEERLGENAYYNLQFTATFDADRPEGEFRLGGDIPAENEFRMDVTTFDTSQLASEEGCVSWCEAGNPVISNERSRPSAGSFTLDALDRDKDIAEGSFDLTFGNDSVTGRFKAERCDRISEWFGLGG